MADLLTHVLVPFIVLIPLAWWVDFDRRWVPIAMGGAVIPDLGKLGLVIDDSVVETVLGVPFSYGPVGTVAGVLAISAAIAVWFDSNRAKAYGWLLTGGSLSLVTDGLRAFADGLANFWLYPLWWRPPTPSLYVSSDYRVTVLAILLSIAVFAVEFWKEAKAKEAFP